MAFTVEAETEQCATTNLSPSSMSDPKLYKLLIAIKELVNNTLEELQYSSIQFVAGDIPYPSAANFEDLNLSDELLRGLYAEMKFRKPSKIQAISLPMILTPPFKHLVAQAHNGSGKTTCFVLGILSRVDPQLRAPQALCICPTRELSLQNLEVLRRMGKYTGITSSAAVPLDLQNEKSRDRSPILSQVVIGTPWTTHRLVSQKRLGLRTVKVLVFDEADHTLANDGFQDDSLRIIKAIEPKCQVLLFSATFNEAVKAFVPRVVKDYNQLFVKKEELSLESIKQFKVRCPDEPAKIMVIKDRILKFGEKVGQTIIFVNSKQSASMLHKELVELGAVFNLLMTYGDDKLMAKIEKFYGTEVAEVKSLDNVEEFKAALGAAVVILFLGTRLL